MLLTGPKAEVRAMYERGPAALAVPRRDFDAWLLEQAIAAGARFEDAVTARRPLIEDRPDGAVVRGLALSRPPGARELRMPAIVTIAADGRRSILARALGLMRPAPRPPRWAYGTYATGVTHAGDVGEMHVRHGWYLGIAPLGQDLVNVCVVRPAPAARLRPLEVLREAIDCDDWLVRRFDAAVFDDRVRVLGPLAADLSAMGTPGFMLAGDAAGFVDPMTGDGVHLALQSARLAAAEALHALETGDVAGMATRLAAARQATFGSKVRFNRAVRRLVDSPRAVDAATAAARVWPGLVRSAVRYAGDVR
jgi:flavin-dependent dehydrogenase